MRRLLFGWLLAMPAIVQAADPWTPAGEWKLENVNAKCTMGRVFRSGSQTISLYFVAEMIGGTHILVAMPTPLYDRLAKTVTLSASGVPPLQRQVVYLGRMGESVRLVSIKTPPSEIETMLSAKEISIRYGKTSLVVDAQGSPGAWATLGECASDLPRLWKINPDEIRNDLHPDPNVKGSDKLELWPRPEDYPGRAMRDAERGDVGIIWRIETDGRVRDCRVVESSGSTSLDETSCELVRKRAQYRPLVDPNGRPAVKWERSTFHWKLT